MSSDDRDDLLLWLAVAVLVAVMLALGCRSIIVDREKMNANCWTMAD